MNKLSLLLLPFIFASPLIAKECTCECTCTAAVEIANPKPIATGDLIRIKAVGGPSYLAVRAGTKELFKGNIHEGKEIEIKHVGSVDVFITSTENIIIERHGQSLRGEATGTSKIHLPAQTSETK
ncbi:MAG: hypothetical protein ABS34_10805 [Opitutaceae bacterium BACL24 MAG-120322-bin51]|jgi:hypothetical protein|nr:MAG: hypothetical protein ABS34_10805 [Opitutaceae bacterium BACL24 MAG-120322-bin51]